ncbi:hypothetical protein [Lysobacter sp. Hz 25]|uniref:hypothetical protein n=1 Tax=Lysobacter sp. Hz 25 TaxID=3383698 RepID=UPI0038D3FA86
MDLPMRLFAVRIAKPRAAKRVASASFGVATIFVLRVLGFVLWFALCMVPITFSKEMNALFPVAVWFGMPFFIGIGLAAMLQRRRE